MRARGFVALGAATAAIMLGPALPAQAAPSGPGSADQVIDELERRGIVVIVEPGVNTPLDRATARNVRPGEDYRGLAGDLVFVEVG